MPGRGYDRHRHRHHRHRHRVIVIIIGGLGSIGGCFAGALLVGLVANYVGYLSPKIALGSNILLMVLVLLWRPQGLYPVTNR